MSEKAAEDAPEFHAENVGVGGTLWTAHLQFKTISLIGGQGLESPLVTVKMNWQIAKALHAILGNLIDTYEASQGHISMPSSAALPPMSPGK